MFHPTIIIKNGELRYNQLLQEAETDRRYRRSHRNHFELRQRIGTALIQLGKRLQNRPQSATSPAYRAR